MSEDRPDLTSERTSDELPEDLGGRSIFVTLGEGLGGVSLQDLDDESPLEVRAGAEKYQVLKTVGEGGMGKVYAAVDRDLKRPVALKMMRASGDRKLEQRFLEEAQVMGQLQHPNILAVHELGLTEKKKLYYTMPLVRGRTLKTVLDELRQGQEKTRRTWSVTRLVQLLQDVGQAVDYAHAKGVIHRDLKPANVMVGEHGEVQVLDWGLAKVMREGAVKTDLALSLTGTGHLVGTPAYMSPEQAKGEEVDERTDVYAVGAMLYEALTWKAPFAGPTLAILHAVVHTEPPAPRSAAPERNIPLELEAICLKALRKDRAARQATLGELVQELQIWLESESDKAKRHERAEEKAAEGRAKLAEYFRLKDEVMRLEAEAEEVAQRFEPWQPRSEKAVLFGARTAVVAARKKLTRAASETVTTLSAALGFEPEHAAAREALADYYCDRFREAEARHDEEEVEFFGDLVAEYHGGKYERELKGDGTLELTSEPSGAEVWLSRQEEDGPVLVDGEAWLVGTTPLAPTPLAMESWVVVLKKEGYREQRYPVHITRNREWKGEVRLCTEEEAGPGFRLVPGGPCVLGGDAEAFNSWPRKEEEVGDFFLAEHPVTIGEYLEYLNEVARREGLEAA